MSPLPPSPPNPEKFSATVSANALLHVKADGFWPSSMEQLGKPMTVLVYFQVTQHKTHFTKDGYMWYLVRFYSFNCPLCDMHELILVQCFAAQQSSPSIQFSD